MEALWSLVPRETWEREASVPLHEIRIHRGGRPSRPLITPDVVREAGVQPWFTNPNRTRELLLALGSFELRRGIEVTGVLRERERVVGVRAASSPAARSWSWRRGVSSRTTASSP